MGFFDRLSRLIRATLNSWIGQVEDPEKILEQAVIDMQEDLVRLRQAVAQAIATQKRTERQQSQAAMTAQEWHRRAQLALQKGDENLAREALTRRKSYQDTADALQQQIQQQAEIVAQMKRNLAALESKLAEAKTKKDMYIARARSAKATEKINEMLGQVGTSGAMAAFERMEEKVLQLETKAEAIAELNTDTLEKQFALLEHSSDVDAELEAMKAQLISGSTPNASLPAGQTPTRTDAELEQLRAHLEEG